MHGHRASVWSATIFLAILLACAFGTGLALDASRTTPPDGESLNAVYFTTGYSAALTPADARSLGIEPVATFAALQVKAATADAIIIDREALPQVPTSWLAQQHRRGALIIGINIPSVELAQRAEYEGRVGDYLQSYGGRAFYSYFYQRRVCGGRRSGSGSDAIYSTGIIVWLLHKAQQEDCPLLLPSSQPARPRPTVTTTPLPRSGP